MLVFSLTQSRLLSIRRAFHAYYVVTYDFHSIRKPPTQQASLDRPDNRATRSARRVCKRRLVA